MPRPSSTGSVANKHAQARRAASPSPTSCRTRAGSAGEVTITKLAEGRYYVLSGAGAEDRDMDYLTQGDRWTART